MLTFYDIEGQAYPCYTYIGDFSCFSTVWVCTNELKLKSRSLTYLVAFFREAIFYLDHCDREMAFLQPEQRSIKSLIHCMKTVLKVTTDNEMVPSCYSQSGSRCSY